MSIPRMLVALLSICVVCNVALAADGEGTAAVEPADKLVAGSSATIAITYKVGPSGIPVGGSVALGLHHAASWPGLQITAPAQPGYMAVRCNTPDNFELEWHPWWAPRQAIPGRGDSIFHRCLFATVQKEPLAPGEEVRIILGANDNGTAVQRYVEKTCEFHVMTDADGDGVYKGIQTQPIGTAKEVPETT